MVNDVIELEGQTLADFQMYTSIASALKENDDPKARSILDESGVPTEEWFMTNALLSFRQSGDSIESRAALAIAIADNDEIAYVLAGHAEPDEKEDLLEEQINYLKCMTPVWEITPNAIEWLTAQLDIDPPLYGDSDSQDEARIKRWRTNVELAESHIKREDLKSAKRMLKSALREASQMQDGGVSYCFTAELLATVLIQLSDTTTDLIEDVDARRKWLEQQSCADKAALARRFTHLSRVYQSLDFMPGTELCARRAVELLKESIASDVLSTDLYEISESLSLLCGCLVQQKKFAECEPIVAELLSMQERFVGTNHVHLVDALQARRMCLHHIGNHEAELALYDRIIEIDGVCDYGADYGFDCEQTRLARPSSRCGVVIDT